MAWILLALDISEDDLQYLNIPSLLTHLAGSTIDTIEFRINSLNFGEF